MSVQKVTSEAIGKFLARDLPANPRRKQRNQQQENATAETHTGKNAMVRHCATPRAAESFCVEKRSVYFIVKGAHGRIGQKSGARFGQRRRGE